MNTALYDLNLLSRSIDALGRMVSQLREIHETNVANRLDVERDILIIRLRDKVNAFRESLPADQMLIRDFGGIYSILLV